MLSAPAKKQRHKTSTVETSSRPGQQPAELPSPEDRLREAVRSQLHESGYRALDSVDCDIHESRVILFGVVPSYYMKQVAQTVALKLDQVNDVENRVRVRGDNR